GLSRFDAYRQPPHCRYRADANIPLGTLRLFERGRSDAGWSVIGTAQPGVAEALHGEERFVTWQQTTNPSRSKGTSAVRLAFMQSAGLSALPSPSLRATCGSNLIASVFEDLRRLRPTTRLHQ